METSLPPEIAAWGPNEERPAFDDAVDLKGFIGSPGENLEANFNA
jgi:hypothetical protein